MHLPFLYTQCENFYMEVRFMNNHPEGIVLSDEDMDALLKLLFRLDEKEQCTEEVRERLWKKVKESMEFPPMQKSK